MREIKFRVWDGERMVYDESDALNSLGIAGITLDGRPLEQQSYEMSEPIDWPEKWRIMQYTGLKDASDTEIYEGDIVERGGDRFAVQEQQSKYGAWHPFVRSRPGVGYIETYHPSLFAVVGNVHEHPHLMERQEA